MIFQYEIIISTHFCHFKFLNHWLLFFTRFIVSLFDWLYPYPLVSLWRFVSLVFLCKFFALLITCDALNSMVAIQIIHFVIPIPISIVIFIVGWHRLLTHEKYTQIFTLLHWTRILSVFCFDAGLIFLLKRKWKKLLMKKKFKMQFLFASDITRSRTKNDL